VLATDANLAALETIGVAAGLWFHGTWGNALVLPSLILAGIVATNFFEPVATLLDGLAPNATYLFDFLALWGIFIGAYALFRGLTDAFAENWIAFPFPVETAGRSILAIVNAWVMVCFTAFSLHLAPLNSIRPLGAWEAPMDPIFLGMSPDRQWAAFAHSRSRGVLARGNFDPEASLQADQDADVQPFDAKGDFIYRYYQRRKNYTALEGFTTDP
jgi:hypothetical protein